MAKMKYALGHPWRFELVTMAFVAGLLQTSIVVLVTLLNHYVIIVDAVTVEDIAKDFLAMMAIAWFDDILFLEYPAKFMLKTLL